MNMNTSDRLDYLAFSIAELRSDVVEKITSDLDTSTTNHSKRNIPLSSTELGLLQQPDFREGLVGRLDAPVINMPYDNDDVKKLSTKLHNMVTTGCTLATEQDILHSLKFEAMRMRESNIAIAHIKTFDWIMEPRMSIGNEVSQNHFIDWLRYKSGIFWISGKPGSGKSTLMKYLVNHPNMKSSLRIWASHQVLVTGYFFFWNAGKPMQKSQQGLLQSLLFEVLRQCPSLIGTTFPSRWKDLQGQKGNRHVLTDWTLDELKGGFKRLVKVDITSAKFCFFIDGLDEYDGYSTDITETLDDFTTSAHVKICLSSRPWPAFQTAYGDPTRSLKLQDLTRNDIRLYVREKLEEHKTFILLKNEDPRYMILVEEIVEKAKGVFLWVVLVVQSFKEGISNADSTSILTKRLRELPSDLDKFFRHILGQVDKVYWEGTTQAFEMAICGAEQLPLWLYSVLDEEDPDFAIRAQLEPLSVLEVEKMGGYLEKRLNARCKGLLEVVSVNPYPDIFSKNKVDFLHRTVRDFLRMDDIQKLLAERLEKSFDPNLTLCKALLAQAKAVSAFETTQLEKIFLDFSYYARRTTKLNPASPTLPLDAIARLAQPKQTQLKQSSALPSLHPLVIQKCRLLYMEQQLQGTTRPVQSDQAAALLEVALLPPCNSLRHDEYIHPHMVQLLLEHGADPNHDESNLGGTIWIRFLDRIYRQPSPLDEERNTWFTVIDRLLRGGADPTARVKVQDENLSIEAIFSRIFKPGHAMMLTRLLSMRQRLWTEVSKLPDSRLEKLPAKNSPLGNSSPPESPSHNSPPQILHTQNIPPLEPEPELEISDGQVKPGRRWRMKWFFGKR